MMSCPISLRQPSNSWLTRDTLEVWRVHAGMKRLGNVT